MKRVLLCVGLLAASFHATAAVTPVAYWRMGETENAAPGVAGSTPDAIAGRTLTLHGTPFYSADVGATALAGTGSTRSIDFFSGGPYGDTALFNSATDNFGIELWVKSTTTSGSHTIAYNGNTGSSGWGLVQVGGSWQALFGGVTFFGSAPVTAGAWTHLALVRASGTATLYVDGVASGTSASAPNAPAGAFAVGVSPPTFNTEFIAGLVDEVRIFTFADGAFASTDLLLNHRAVTNTNDSGAGSLRAAMTTPPSGTIIDINTTGTLTLSSILPFVANALTINGPGSGSFTIDGANLHRVFFVDAPSAPIGIRGITIANGRAKGGDGGDAAFAGGGGMGAGGGLFVNRGDVSLADVAFAGNAAVGGKGGDAAGFGTVAGGGGLGGKGGNANPNSSGIAAGGGGGFLGDAGGAPFAGAGGGGGVFGTGGNGADGGGTGGGGGGAFGAGQPGSGSTGGQGANDPIGGDGGTTMGNAAASGGNGLEYGGGGGASAGSFTAGSGGSGGRFGGGGGATASSSTGQSGNGGQGGDFGGGGGAHGSGAGIGGGSGGFGGGGGGGNGGRSGSGGFGGGSGACGVAAWAGTAGLFGGRGGAPNNAQGAGGGGGGALGGSVFVRGETGATLTVNDPAFDAGTITAGTGGAGGSGPCSVCTSGGIARGSTMFLYGGTTTLAVGSGSRTISGTIAGTTTQPATLVKSGVGSLSLANTVTELGPVNVVSGTLQVASTLETTLVTVGNGATIAGTGTIGALAINAGGTLAPGASPGQLIAGATTFTGAGNYNWQLRDATGAAGTGYDTLRVNGTLDVTNASGFAINLWTLSSVAPDTDGAAANFNPAANATWILVRTTGGVVGFAASSFSVVRTAANGAAGFANATPGTFAVSVDGKDLVLNYLAPADIAVEQVGGGALADGASVAFGPINLGNSTSLQFELRNAGFDDLLLTGTPKVAITGANAADFTVTTQPSSPIAGVYPMSNRGFEAPVQGGGGFTYAPTGTEWTYGASAGVARNGSPWFVNAAREGQQAAFIQTPLSGDTSGAFVTRPIVCTALGAHTITFRAVRRGNTYEGNDVAVRMDAATLATIPNTSQPDDTWRAFSAPYTCVDTATHVLAFAGTRTGADYATAIDDVQFARGAVITTFDVSFAPSALGARTAALSIASNDADENPFDLVLGGIGGAPELDLEQPAGTPLASGGARNFGTVNAGQNTSLTFTIRSAGTGPLSGIGASIAGPDAAQFTITTPPAASLAPGDSTTFVVRYTPSAAGPQSATLSIASNDADENPYVVSLSGTGAAPEIVVEQPAGTGVADGGSRDFGTVAVGSVGTLDFTIRNTGNGDLTGLATSIDGADAAAFKVTTSPAAPVAPNGSTSFVVRFTPTAGRAYAATLHIASNDADENPFDIALGGIGDNGAPGATTLPGVGSSSSTMVLHGAVNPQGAATDVHFEYGPTIAYGSSTTPVAIGSGNAALPARATVGSLAPDSLAHFRVVAVSSAGTRYGQDRTVRTRDDSTVVVAYYRMGEIDPGAASGGVSTATLDSAGVNDLAPTNAPQYSADVAANAALGAGSLLSLPAQASGSLVSNATENFVLELWVKSDPGPGTTVLAYNGTYGNNGFGLVRQDFEYKAVQGNQTFGTGALAFGQWTHLAFVRANNTSTFYVDGVARGSSFFPVFPPAGAFTVGGVLVDEVRVSTFPGGQYDAGDLLLPHAEIRLEQPVDTYVPDGGARGFGAVNTGATSDLVFTVRNIGSADLTGVAATIVGADAAQFAVTASPAGSVAPDGSTTFTVRFAPTSSGAKSAVLRVASNDPDENPYDVNLTGSGAGPEIVLEQPTGVNLADGGNRDFGTVSLGANSSLDFLIRNTGSAALTLSGNPRVQVGGANASDFAVTQQPAATIGAAIAIGNAGFEAPVLGGGGFQYAPSGAQWTFGARAGIARNGSPWFVNAAPEGGQAAFIQTTGDTVGSELSMPLSFPSAGDYLIRFAYVRRGDANPGIDVAVRVDDVTLGTVQASAQVDDAWRMFSVPYTCTVAGSHVLKLAGTLLDGDRATAIDAVTIEPISAGAVFRVRFMPTAGGTRNATLSIANNDFDENPFDVAVSGTGFGTGADVQLSKTNFQQQLVQGSDTVYTIQVLNAGPSSVTSVQVVDTLPPELTNGAWTCTSSPPSLCPAASGNGNIDQTTSATLASGSMLQYSLVARVAGSAGGFVGNTASATILDAGVGETVPANNSATDTDPIVGDGIFKSGFEDSGATLLRDPL